MAARPADYVLALLFSAGYEPLLLKMAPRRANVVLRCPGYPARCRDSWSTDISMLSPPTPGSGRVPPFEGRVADGYVWGRGAMDMKYMIAMMLSTLVRWSRTMSAAPGYHVRLVADEEHQVPVRAEWLLDHPADLFCGVTAAISESGGEPVDVTGAGGVVRRFYPCAVGERGSLHVSASSTGAAGHGAFPHDDNPVVHLVKALNRLIEHRWPLQFVPAVAAYMPRQPRA